MTQPVPFTEDTSGELVPSILVEVTGEAVAMDLQEDSEVDSEAVVAAMGAALEVADITMETQVTVDAEALEDMDAPKVDAMATAVAESTITATVISSNVIADHEKNSLVIATAGRSLITAIMVLAEVAGIPDAVPGMNLLLAMIPTAHLNGDVQKELSGKRHHERAT